jgi:septal ring factor EnvC (AmiA/AmiB activator)
LPINLLRLLLVLALTLPGMAFAAPDKEAETRKALRDAERRGAEQQAARKQATEAAANAAAELLRLAGERVEAAAKLRIAETAIQDIATRIDGLAQRQREAEQRVQVRAKALQPMLPLIERLSLYPAETLLAVPAPPEDAMRGILVLQGLSRQIEREAEALRRDQAEAEASAAELRALQPLLAAAETVRRRQSDALDQAIEQSHAEQAAAEGRAKEAATRAAMAASRAESLKGALAAIEAQRRADEARAREDEERAQRDRREAEAEMARERGAAAARPTGAGTIPGGSAGHGQLQPPVIGVVVTRWGDPTDAGPATGLSYHAPPGARVISPCAGRVVFAEPFRSYGLLVIADCGGGYHAVLSGFDRLNIKLGQKLVAGEPLGTMPLWEPGSTARRPALYLELRHDGTPVNPGPWLRSVS